MSTTQWAWQNISRGIDYSATARGNFKRNNWLLARYRMSNDVYASELGDEVSSLNGYNGGVLEQALASSITSGSFLKFSGTPNWSTPTMEWVETGRIINGQPTYRPNYGEANVPVSTKTNVAYFWERSGQDDFWYVVEAETAEVDSLSWSATPTDFPNRSGTPDVSSNEIDGKVFNNPAGTFTGIGTAYFEAATAEFFCSADNQVYQQQSVDWFTQVQNWIYKDSWTVA